MPTLSPTLKKALSAVLFAVLGALLLAVQQQLVPMAPAGTQPTLIALLAGIAHYLDAWGHKERVEQAADKAVADSKRVPWVPPMPMLLLLTLVLACGLPGCSLFGPGGSVWPAIGTCAPSTDTLFSEVESVLTSSGGSYEDDLLALGKTEGLSFVECAVQSVVEALSARIAARAPGARITPDESIGVARGKAFLAKIAEAHQ